MRDARAVRDARDVRDARTVREGGARKADVPIRRARGGVPQERVTPRTRGRPPRRGSEPSGRALEPRERRTGGRPIPDLIARQPWASLESLLVESSQSQSRLEKLERFGRMLLEWNRGVSNLISRHDEPRLVDRHFHESVEPARWLANSGCRNWIDLGSGAGLPAIPLAIAGVGDRWTLVESRRTKTLFMRKTLEELGLSNVEVVLGRLEKLIEAGQVRQAFDGFTSRATMALGPTLDIASSLVIKGGYSFLWKGSRRAEEMEKSPGWQAHWEWVEERALSGGNVTVICFRKND